MTRWKLNVRVGLEAAAVAAALLFPNWGFWLILLLQMLSGTWIAMLLDLRNLPRRPVWSLIGAVVLIGINRLLVMDFAGLLTAGLFLLSQVMMIALLRLRFQSVLFGFILFLSLGASFAWLDNWQSARSWLGPPGVVVTSWDLNGLKSRFLEYRDGYLSTLRWTQNPASPLTISFEARGSVTDGSWFFSQPQSKAVFVNGVDSATRLEFIAPNSYAYREVQFDRPIEHRRFRVTLELRSDLVLPLDGCRGVWLQSADVPEDRVCRPTALEPVWKTFQLEFVPTLDSQNAKRLRVLLLGFTQAIEVRHFRLEEFEIGNWQTVGPVQPTPVTVRLFWSDAPSKAVATLPMEIEDQWKLYSVVTTTFPVGRQSLTALLEVRPRTELEVRNVQAVSRQGQNSPVPQAPLGRATLWFESPNLLGHALVASGLAVACLWPHSLWALFAVALSLFGITLTGSRAALSAWVIGLIGVVWIAMSGRQRIVLLGVLLLSATVFLSLYGSQAITRFQVSDGSIPRPEIWAVATKAILEHPLGLGLGQFQGYFLHARTDLASQAIFHAHNFWLELGVRYGFLGLLASMILTFALLEFAWRLGSRMGLMLLMPLLIMNFFDYTLFFPSVMIVLYLGLNSMRAKTKELEHSSLHG